MTKNIWQKISSQDKYVNPWIQVIEDQVIGPDGKPGIYATVKIKEGISVLPVDDENNVYLINEFRYPLNRTSIETAGGGLDDNESALDCAKRELKEELGIEAKEWVDLGLIHPLTAYIDCPNRLFLARGLSFSETSLDPNENILEVKTSLQEAVDRVMNGSISEAKTCTLILKANEYIRNH